MLVSVWLDSELSEFELAMMRAHLASCPSCAAHADSTVALTGMLRLRPLEPLPCPVFIPHRQRGSRRVIGASVAVAAIVAAVGVGLGTKPFSTSRAVSGSLPAAYPASLLAPPQIDDRENWAGGLPRVSPTELPVPLGQRQVSTDT